MSERPPDMPTFGTPSPEGGCVDRLAVYALIRGEEGRVALVRTEIGLSLPGGGVEEGEGLEAALRREVREECAFELRIHGRVGEALQYHGQYRSRHVFFAAEFVGGRTGASEYEVEWFDPAEAVRCLYHRSHAWAVARVAGTSLT
jgi:ADP-ribose pyrophosphatase YjhB (NUDIX family)